MARNMELKIEIPCYIHTHARTQWGRIDANVRRHRSFLEVPTATDKCKTILPILSTSFFL